MTYYEVVVYFDLWIKMYFRSYDLEEAIQQVLARNFKQVHKVEVRHYIRGKRIRTVDVTKQVVDVV